MPVGTGISAQQGMLSVSETKRNHMGQGLGNTGMGGGGGGGGEAKQLLFSSPEHEVLMVSYCGQSMSVVRHAASTIALKAYSSYTPGPIDLILGRKHRGDL